jgi:tetratricopeptide (TPR) repeat protein/predicted Ser/Thr protein kinase
MADSRQPESPRSTGPLPAAKEPYAPEEVRSAPVAAGADPSGQSERGSPLTHWTQPDDPTRASDNALDGIVDLEGARIAGYQLLEELHRGGQGVVYKAIQLGTKRCVALKVMLEGPFAGESTRRRFEREVELAASLRHPYIVTILDSGASEGRLYFAMEFIDGLRLDRYLAKSRPSLRDTLALFEKICAAVNFAHQRGVIHRDIKPPNILIDASGEPHILDFGLAKPAHRTDPESSTLQVLSTAGQLLGTIAYMSPEQAIGSQDVDVRSDVYSLGVVFYEALLGELPYAVEGPLGEVLTRIVEDEPRRPRGLRRGSRFGNLLNDELETILLKALEKDPARRYQTAGDLGRDLGHLLAGEPIEARPASGLYILRKMLRRYRLQAAAAGSVLVTLIVFLVLFAILWRNEREAADRATRQEAFALQRAAEAQQARDEANRGKQDLEQALIEQTIQRGKLAEVRGDLVGARDYYWDAYEHGSPAAHWALRQYYKTSGDGGAAVLYCANEGPVAISRDGALAAFCETPESITVRRLADAQTVRWLPVPGRVTVLNVYADGTLCAGGAGWARLWSPDSVRSLIARELPDDFGLRGVHSLFDGGSLILVGEKKVYLARADQAGPDETLNLMGAVTGNTDCLPENNLLALATSGGVELVVVGEEGGLRSELVGLRELASPPRYVLFAGNHLFAATHEALYRAAVRGSALGVWQRSADVPLDWRTYGVWDLLDVNPDARAVVAGMRDGSTLLFRRGRHEHIWPVAAELVGLRLTPDAASVLTLDKTGTVTRWEQPAPQTEDRLVLAQPSAKWASADDGSAVLVADEHDRIFAYAPQRSAACEPIPVRRGLRLPLPGAAELALGVSHDADRVAICMDGAVRLRDRASGAAYNATWNDKDVPVLKAVALTGDGQHLAFYAQSKAGDRQRIVFYRWQPRVQTARSIDLETLLPACSPAVEFVGSAIRETAFVPGTSRLIVARSNGELVLLEAESQAAPLNPGVAPLESPEPWVVLDSPAIALTFDARGEQLAAACDDGFIRVLTLADAKPKCRIRPPEPVRTLAFNPAGQVLLARGQGDASVIDLATGERVLQVPISTADPGMLAAWIGRNDTMLFGQSTGIFEHDYNRTDALIAQNRSYARQRAVARKLAEGEVEHAWAEIELLNAVDPACATNMRVLVLEAALRRRSQDIPPAWLDSVADITDPATWLRLGHAAYEGERFAQAGTWLGRGAELSGGQLDASTELRIAQCRYLAGDYLAAAEAFGQLTQRPDLYSALLPTVQLEQVAALVLGQDAARARSIAAHIGSFSRAAVRADPAAMDAARDIARTLTGLETERPVIAWFTQLAAEAVENLRVVDLRFHDDAYFFEGELARVSGNRAHALASYQRCIDLARDEWPSGWARYRLRQLSQGT